jgi:hypothetical protein
MGSVQEFEEESDELDELEELLLWIELNQTYKVHKKKN